MQDKPDLKELYDKPYHSNSILYNQVNIFYHFLSFFYYFFMYKLVGFIGKRSEIVFKLITN